eukprot:10916576-Alexandrium_andersonii.AAC.1
MGLTFTALGRESKTVYPELSSNYKAAHVKILLAYMAHLTYKLGLTDRRSQLRASLFWGIAKFLHVLDLSLIHI